MFWLLCSATVNRVTSGEIDIKVRHEPTEEYTVDVPIRLDLTSATLIVLIP